MKSMEYKKKPTIAELEKILNSKEENPIEILPNGKIRTVKKRRKNTVNKPVTRRIKPSNRIHEITSDLLNSDFGHKSEEMTLHARITGIIKFLDEQHEKEKNETCKI